MPIKRWIESANNAIEGILEAARSQRHVRYHFYATAAVVFSGLLLNLSRGEFLLLSLAAIVVVVAELLNTALESAVDLFAPGLDERARITKDVAAGAVLVAAAGAVLIGYVVMAPHAAKVWREGFVVVRRPPADVAVIAVILVLIIVILGKAFFHRGAPLRGGFPSGHAAVAFSVLVSVASLLGASVLTGVALLGAVAVAASRIALGVHSFREVFWGAVIGTATTFLLFLLFA